MDNYVSFNGRRFGSGVSVNNPAQSGASITGEESATPGVHPSVTIAVYLEMVYPPGQMPSLAHVHAYLECQLNMPEPDDPDQPFTLRRVVSASCSELAPTLGDGR